MSNENTIGVKHLCCAHVKSYNDDTIRIIEDSGETCEHCGSTLWRFEYIPFTRIGETATSNFGTRCFNIDCMTFSKRLFTKKLIDMVRLHGVQPGALFPAAPQ